MDRIGHKIRILADDSANRPLVGDVLAGCAFPGAEPLVVISLVLDGLEMERHRGAAGVAVSFLNGVRTVPGGSPEPRRVLSGLSGQHLHRIGHHEGRIETHAELTDEFRRQRLLSLGHVLQKFSRPRLGDGTEVGHEILPVHADAVVGHAQDPRGSVHGNADVGIRKRGLQRLARERGDAQLVQRVRRVGHEFPQKNFPIGIDGVDHEVQQLLPLALK